MSTTDECQCPHHPFGCYGHPDKCNCASPSPASPADDVAGLVDRAEQLAASLNRGSADIVLELAAALSRLQAKMDKAIRSADAVCNSYAAENQRLFDRAEAAEASAATMREALTKAGVIAFEMRARDKRNGILTDWWQERLDALIAALGGQHG